MRLRHATKISVAFATILVALLGFIGCISLSTAGTDDAGAIQGFLVSTVGGLLVIAGVLLMPLIAARLLASGRFTRLRWGVEFFAVLCVASMLFATAAGYIFGFDRWLVLAALLLAMATVAMLPFAALWLWLAGSPPNTSLERSRDR